MLASQPLHKKICDTPYKREKFKINGLMSLYHRYKLKFDKRINIITSVHRYILIEATSSQKVWATRVSSGNQGGEPTLGH
jgi:hypothetical protein